MMVFFCEFGTKHVPVQTDSLAWHVHGMLSIDISLFLFHVLFHVLIGCELAEREIIEK